MKISIRTDRGIAFGFRKVFGRRFWRHDRMITVQIGQGAGYIGGSTFYVAVNCHSLDTNRGGWHRHPFAIGWTRNANRVPLCYH